MITIFYDNLYSVYNAQWKLLHCYNYLFVGSRPQSGGLRRRARVRRVGPGLYPEGRKSQGKTQGELRTAAEITKQDIHTKLLWTVSLCLHDVLTTATIHSLVCLQPALPLLCPYSCTWAVAEFKSLHSWLNYLRVIIQVIRNTHPVRKYNYLTPNDAYMCTIIGTTHNWCIKCHRKVEVFTTHF